MQSTKQNFVCVCVCVFHRGKTKQYTLHKNKLWLSNIVNNWVFFPIKIVINSKNIDNTIQKFVLVRFLKMFLKEVSYAHQGCIYIN